MPPYPPKHDSAALQRQLRTLLGLEQIVTQAYGRQQLIKRPGDEEPTVVARLSELGRTRYGTAFCSHSGRWKLLPGTGSLEEMADVVVTLLLTYTRN
ncbi:hypothetical protein [Paraburkholderia caledonica]|uniref:Uncharacterized protein n=1 Tax=Paraburkholderia caledonica TaxID=134536 RepID=A0AB73IML4_9BURK|nr:hypothetical protein [Paraburkholderia caledonica]